MQKCKKLYRGLDMRILTCYNNIIHPGIAKLVSRLVWDQETVRSSRTTRTKSPLKSLVSEGFSYSLSIAAQEVSMIIRMILRQIVGTHCMLTYCLKCDKIIMR